MKELSNSSRDCATCKTENICHLTVYRKRWPPLAYVKLKLEKRIMSYCFCVWIKNPPTNAGDTGDKGSIPGPGRSPSGGTGSPLQCSRLENPMDRGAWRAAVRGVTGSHTTEQQLSKHACTYFSYRPFLRVCFQIFSRFLNTVRGKIIIRISSSCS